VPTLFQPGWKRAPWVALTALAVALTLDLPTIVTVIDRSSGIADLATLGKHLSGIAASAAVLDWVAALASVSSAPRLRVHHAVAAAAMIAMTSLFALMPRPEAANFTATVSGGLPAVYLQVFYAYLGVAMAVATVLFWRTSRLSPRGSVRWGFWLLATGTTGGACYAAYQTCYLLLRVTAVLSAAQVGSAIRDGTDLEYAAIAFILAGLSVPAFGVAASNAHDLLALRALRGLWRDLIHVVPRVTAGTWKHPVAGSVRDPRIRLIRRTAEIRDAALALRCYVSPAAVDTARDQLSRRGLAGTALSAATEACWLELAIHAAHACTPATETAHVMPGGQTLPEEVRWLRQIAAARRSAHVRAVTAQLVRASLTYQEGSPR
jgi:hypothetical protein